jgi:spermidine/putrescine transport system permease protein
VEQLVRADHARDVGPAGPARASRRRARAGKALAPYLLSLPAGLWLLALFLIPLVVMLSLSLQTCNFGTGACVMTWRWGEFGHQISLYHSQFVTSFYFAGAATLIDLVVSFPIAYWIAFYGGTKKNFFLLMLLVPFFVSFVIRTIVWEFILSDQGIILGNLKHAHLLPQNFHVLATGYAVVAGLAYNYLPFTALPLYVAIERIDKTVLDAAYDLYASKRQAFTRVILPLTIPGLFAAFLLTFIPALGDYVNQQILGGTSNTMIGTVIQNSFLTYFDYAGGSALSAVLMAIALIGIFAYARLLGSRTIEEYL